MAASSPKQAMSKGSARSYNGTRKPADKWQYGDFQTPDALAEQAIKVLKASLPDTVGTIIEPTCGNGSFLAAAASTFRSAQKIIGLDINASYLQNVRNRIKRKRYAKKVELLHADFFATDWQAILSSAPQPILIIGNPPWVTNADLGGLKSDNLPQKTNFQNHRGLAAITGKANFDISEWMLVKLIEWLRGKTSCVAMLCKTAVARKVLKHIWKAGIPTKTAKIYSIDALQHFGAAVDACFLIVETLSAPATNCDFYDTFETKAPDSTYGYYDQTFVSDVPAYLKHRDLLTENKDYTWRSGVKHDCSSIMELEKSSQGYRNAHGEELSLEQQFVFPLLKSSDLGNGRVTHARKHVIITQKMIGEDTSHIRKSAPKTWSYLSLHKEILDRRASSIYRNKPPFSIFGIGAYSFSDWKVAISGFYKQLKFSIVGPIDGRPTMLDDTAYFIECKSRAEAEFMASLLNSPLAQASLGSLIFWSDKRPITSDLLSRLNIRLLARTAGLEKEYCRLVDGKQSTQARNSKSQLTLTL